MPPVDEDAVRAMTWRAIQEVNGLTWANDSELLTTLMRCALTHGFNFDMLEAFRGAHRIGCFGFFRDRTHYAAACRVEVGFRLRSGLMVQTDGEFGGVWVFMLDGDSSVLTSRDGQGVQSFQDLDGPELIEAVITSALTADLAPQPEKRSLWRRRF
jgi:hypothetical protein